VRDERRTGQFVCLGSEFAVLPRGYRLLVYDGLAVALEYTDSGSVGVSLALLDEVVGRIE
jgi:hypothetical protein